MKKYNENYKSKMTVEINYLIMKAKNLILHQKVD